MTLIHFKLWLKVAAIMLLLFTTTTLADHRWGTYHWARTANPLPLLVVDSTTPDWDVELQNSLIEWNKAATIAMVVDSANDSSKIRKRCPMVNGQMRVCNAAYGQNGWLGLASINIDANGHILKGTVKVNDSYGWYWTPEDKNHVMCQEIGHIIGLGHTSEDGSSQQTCMDYSRDPNSQWPNAHDYDLIDNVIYAHLDSYNTYAEADNGGGGNEPPCRGGPKKCGSGFSAKDFGLGHKIYSGEFYQHWVVQEDDGTLTFHHVRLVPGEHTEHQH